MNAPLPPVVKVCGITSPADAVLCLEAGATWLGLIFAPGPRRVGTIQAIEIRRAVPDAVVVGVFLDAPLETVLATTATAGLDLVQLHGSESPAYCAELRARAGVPLIKAVGAAGAAAQLAGPPVFEAASYLLFDHPKSAPGDGGRAAGWSDADDRLHARASAASRAGRRAILAGGLHAGNVRAAIARVRPFAVDVSRGVEQAPGVKDAAALREFMAPVRRPAASEVRHARA